MISRKFIWPVVIMLSILLGACNIGATPIPTDDPGAIQTEAFNLVNTQAADQLTQTALAQPPTALPTNTPPPSPTLGSIPTFDPASGTNTPFAFNTQQPGLTPFAAVTTDPNTPGAYSTITTENGCNNGWMLSEGGIYDGKTIFHGTDVTKSWDIYNSGTCAWDEGYSFTFRPEYSSSPEGASINYINKDIIIGKGDPVTKPGETRTFTITFKVPNKVGEYLFAFKMKDDGGNLFGPLVFTKFISVEK